MIYIVTKAITLSGQTFMPGQMVKLTEEQFKVVKDKVTIAKKITKQVK